jgi:hypothetical protein
MSVIPVTQETEAGGSQFQASLGKVIKTLPQKQNTNKRAGSVVQVVECLPSMRGPGFNLQYHEEEKEKKTKEVLS